MGRYVTGFILLFIAIGANSQDDAVAPADSYTVIKETGICEVCVCTKAKVNCNDKFLSSSFSLEEWTSLTDINPTKVDLSDNHIMYITPIAYLPIEELDLGNNIIDSIDNAFRNLPHLRELDLSFNRLSIEHSPHAFEGHYSSGEYQPFANMRVLNLAYNDFHSLNQEFIARLPELTSLDLSGNPLYTIGSDTMIAISSLPMLKELRLRDCQLLQIPDKFFHTPRYLERLDIGGNVLTSIPQALENSKNLIYLNLNENPIEELDMEAGGKIRSTRGFPRLPKLEELHMSNMPALTRIGQGALGGLERLAILYLNYNQKLTDIHPKALAKDNGEVYDWPIIKELYLQSNNLSKIDRQLVARWDLVEKMDISGNPLICDCSTQWMVDELVTVMESTRVYLSEIPVCQEPEEMRGSTLQHLHDIHRKMLCMAEPEVDEVMNQTKVDEVMSQIEGHEVINHPEGDEVMNQPEVDEVMNQPEGDEVMNQPEVDEVMNQPDWDEVMTQAEGDRVIVPGTYIGILPWMFLAVPILLALMLARRRRSSRGYDKLALAEENYI